MKKFISIVFISLLIVSLAVFPSHASNLPSWYPEDIHAERSHGSNLPHVVDYADVFTDAEEAELTKQINEYIEKYGYDLVIVTDVSNYGLGPYEEQYAIDFYYYNGYGTDSEYSGSVIYLNMDPYNRYVSNVGTGKVEKYYTDDNVNKMQDQTYPYLSEGKYAKAMSVNIELIDELTYTEKNSDTITTSDVAPLTSENNDIITSDGNSFSFAVVLVILTVSVFLAAGVAVIIILAIKRRRNGK